MTEQNNGRPRFKVQKQKTPTWMLFVFIGVPAVVILVLLGLIVNNLLRGDEEPDKQEKDPAAIMREADKLYNEGMTLKAKGFNRQERDKQAQAYFKQAYGKLIKAQQQYRIILDKIKKQNNGVIPKDYNDYLRKMGEISQALNDLSKMVGFGM